MTDPNVTFYGFTPVPRDPDVLFDAHPTASGDHPKQDECQAIDFPLPDSPVVQEVKAFAQVRGMHRMSHLPFTSRSRRSFLNKPLTIATVFTSMVSFK